MYTNVVWHVRLYVFLCKQKTAYEMRISDWSSDVCSSDLDRLARRFQRRRPFAGLPDLAVRFAANCPGARPVIDDLRHRRGECMAAVAQVLEPGQRLRRRPGNGHRVAARLRSEEHTSELQSLMRISYAVFCLKKKKQTHKTTSTKNSL